MAAITMPSVSECAVANSTVGMPASAPPIIGRKSTSATHSAHRSGKGSPRTASVTKTTTPAMTDVSRSPTTYPVTDWLISRAIRSHRSARAGDSQSSSPDHIFGPSSSRSRASAKIVTTVPSTDAAPSPKFSAGLARAVPRVCSLGAFCATHCCRWKRRTRWPIQPWPSAASRAYTGSRADRWVSPLNSGWPNRTASPMNTRVAHPITIATAQPRRRTRRCTEFTMGFRITATNPATRIISRTSRIR